MSSFGHSASSDGPGRPIHDQSSPIAWQNVPGHIPKSSRYPHAAEWPLRPHSSLCGQWSTSPQRSRGCVHPWGRLKSLAALVTADLACSISNSIWADAVLQGLKFAKHSAKLLAGAQIVDGQGFDAVHDAQSFRAERKGAAGGCGVNNLI